MLQPLFTTTVSTGNPSMNTCLKALTIFSTALLLSCTVQEKSWENVSPIFIVDEAKQYIHSTKVVVSIDQDKRLGMPVLGQRTSHQYYGVIGKLAESAEIRFGDSLSDEQRGLLRVVDKASFRFGIGARFRDATEQSLSSTDWLKASSVVNETDLLVSDIERLVLTQDEDALLLIDNRYLMAIDFSSISVFSYVTLYAHEQNLVKLATAAHPYEIPPTLYKNLFSYEFRIEGKYATADDALKGWSNNEGEMVQRAISDSIADLTSQIARDLSFITVKK